MKQALWQIPAILVLSAVLALGANLVRPGGIALFPDSQQQAAGPAGEKTGRAISLERAARLYRQDAAVFIDARPRSAYRAGHIRGAFNIPWHDAEDVFFEVAPEIPEDTPVITYCDGPACNLSDKLADFLSELGFSPVYVLPDGWSRWKNKDLPTASSSANQKLSRINFRLTLG